MPTLFASRLALITGCLLAATQAAGEKAGNFCFAMASTYYEQLYCEVSAKGEGANLPAFYQFKNNNEQTQALLLKRPAARIGVEVKSPVRPRPQPVISLESAAPATVVRPAATQQVAATQPSKPSHSEQSPCTLASTSITCGNIRFNLLTNRHNRHLPKGVLDGDNQMNLPSFQGNVQREADVRPYLYTAYTQYLDAMQRIGLGGVTTSFGKFSYLFYDYHERGIGFEQRFETLYHYLKKDKASLPVSESPADTQSLSLAACAPLQNRYMVCEHGNRNLVFAAQ